ncbi:hypothetical protein LR48_Vigan11g056100 [Vigna angularis]|uniref:Uncharacterized protein n=1 Tax=Phaseolus angularis TaxID=3914 RepID=A0A0L9VRF9_PHAAN|nr:uncharacterized protein HKW66_Vig0173070 [Vigna angularis]KOM57528.1 hypothetical protein LR48_Vigan11g056100 [Vigna angularis]
MNTPLTFCANDLTHHDNANNLPTPRQRRKQHQSLPQVTKNQPLGKPLNPSPQVRNPTSSHDQWEVRHEHGPKQPPRRWLRTRKPQALVRICNNGFRNELRNLNDLHMSTGFATKFGELGQLRDSGLLGNTKEEGLLLHTRKGE